MAKIDFNSAANLALDHTKEVLFKPFSLKKWLALGFVSLFASTMGGSSGGDFPDTDKISKNYDSSQGLQWIQHHWELLALATLAIIIISIFLVWISSVFNFIYTDQIVQNHGKIREPFARFKSLGTSYFWWSIVYGAAVIIAIGVFVVLPGLLIAASGSTSALGIIAIIFAVIMLIVIVLASIIIGIFARDFVLPTMYVRNIRVMQAWHEVLPLLKENAGQLVVYLLLLIAIGIASAIIVLFAVLAAFLIIFIPAGILAAIGFMLWTAFHLTWTTPIIVLAVIVGIIMIMVLILIVQCLSQPALVFARSFALAVLGQADPSLATIHPSTPPSSTQTTPI
ncbi:MAG: DUF7544 domain-containing protein [Armatimonadota bacterium]